MARPQPWTLTLTDGPCSGQTVHIGKRSGRDRWPQEVLVCRPMQPGQAQPGPYFPYHRDGDSYRFAVLDAVPRRVNRGTACTQDTEQTGTE